MQDFTMQRKQSQSSTSQNLAPSRNQIISVRVKTMNGSIYIIHVPVTSTVAAMQLHIEQKTSVPVESQRLLHKAVLLQPNKYLSDYGINDGNLIQLVANMLPEQISSPSISTHRQSEVARTQALTQQNLRTKKHRYLQQRINGFSLKPTQSIQALTQNKITIDYLLSVLNNGTVSNHNQVNQQEMSQKNINMKQSEAANQNQPFLISRRQLSVGDWVDIRDVSGLWVEAQVVSKKQNFVQIHCNGYPDRWNQWIDQTSQRIMPIHTQTVQSQQSPYLSPFPTNKAQLKSVSNNQIAIQTIMRQLPTTLSIVSTLFNELQNEGKQSRINNIPQFKYSFNEDQLQEQEMAQSLRNNRSHHSIQEEEYQYEYQVEELDEYDLNNRNYMAMGASNQINSNLHQDNKILSKMKKQSSGSIKGSVNNKNKNIRALMGSNRYIDAKNIHIGYSKTKSQHEHTLNRQRTPYKINKNLMKDQADYTKQNQNVDKPQFPQSKKQQQAQNMTKKQDKKQYQMDMQQQSDVHKNYTNLQDTSNIYEAIIPSSASKHSQKLNNLQADNMSNKCEQNISNKGDHDDGQSSAKSFGSKRSDRFLDASSMKSLNIDTINHDIKDKQKNKDKDNLHNKKNILIFDNSQAQSVRSQAQNQGQNNKSNYCFNQQGIMEQDSQVNEEVNEQYYVQKKRQDFIKMRATQLAPICDRLGRMLVDLSPHLALMGFKDFNANSHFNQNLSTFTNEGSLQSKFKRFGQIQQQDQEFSSRNSNKYCNFQIPVMLTPWQIAKITKLLSQQNRAQ